VRAILLHNDVTMLAERATYQGAPVDGFGRYLFLLELSHLWGPAILVPGPDGGAPSGELEGFAFHWSFWMDATGSPAGGNAWKDNGDGTFTVSGQSPATVRYSMLDLYLMGLASANEVPPFGVLENAVPPTGITDPFTKQPYGASSFPWFGAAPFTVPATRRMLTMADVITVNGVRAPDVSASPKSWKLGIILLVGASASAAQVSAAEALLEPVAASLAPAFHDATSGRGSLVLVTASPDGPDAGTDGSADDAGSAGPDAGAPSTPNAGQSAGCGCGAAGEPVAAAPLFLPLAAWLVMRRRTRRARCRVSGGVAGS
jgi:uncharacterized protein (TIGR03382 family)